MKWWKLLSGVALMLCSAVVLAGSLEIRQGYVREMPPGQSMTTAFMQLVNTGIRPVAIVAATSDAAQTTELRTQRRVNGVQHADLVRRMVVPAQGQLRLAPTGYYLSLVNLKRTLYAGEHVDITLLDEEGRSYTARLPVVKMLGAVRR